LHCMRSWQVLSERNIFRTDLRDPVLLPIAQMLMENHWEYLYNCACPAFPRLVRDFYGNMIIIQEHDRGLIMQTMVRGQQIQIDPKLISAVIGVLVLPVSGVPFSWWGSQHWFLAWLLWDETPERRQVPLPDQHRCFCSYAPIFSKDCGE